LLPAAFVEQFPNAHQDDIRQESGLRASLLRPFCRPESVNGFHFGVFWADFGLIPAFRGVSEPPEPVAPFLMLVWCEFGKNLR
jgi:hypothetical protein